MKITAGFIFIVFAAKTISAQGGTNDNAEVCLTSANAYRARHKATPPLEWDSTLADKAKEYADVLMRKTLANNGVLSKEIWVLDSRNYDNGWGENLYWGDGKKATTTVEEYCGFADKGWYDEINNYDFSTGGKINGGVIGHFTQMVWKSSTKVGYGVSVAPSPKYGKYGLKMVFVVAKYKPGGNNHPYTANVMPLIGEGCSEKNCAVKENKICKDGACVCASGFLEKSDGTCEKDLCKNGNCECGEDCNEEDYESVDDGHCVSVSKDACNKIAGQLNMPVKPILYTAANRFPPGCYHKVSSSTFYYNEHPSSRECSYRRVCICKP